MHSTDYCIEQTIRTTSMNIQMEEEVALLQVWMQCFIYINNDILLLKNINHIHALLPHSAHLEIQPNWILANLSLQDGPQSGMIIMP